MLKHLSLKNFRNHTKFDLDLGNITVLIGRNGVGKTNVVEAIRFLSLLKSFRAKQQKELIAWGKPAALITGIMNNGKIEVGIDSVQKQVKVNGVKKHITQAVGVIKTVLFSPDDVVLLSGPPALRRRFLDSLLAQRERHYLFTLARYQQVLRQRNAALDMIAAGRAPESDLAVWDNEFVLLASELNQERHKLVDFINLMLPKSHEQASGGEQTLELKPRWSTATKQTLATNLSRDVAFGSTTIGPHHDDFSLLLNGKDIGRFGSRGENRTAIFALKISEIEYLGGDPVLLLDDIFSELDHNRRQRLQQLIVNHQTLITTTDEHYVSEDLKKIAKIVELQ